MTNIEGQKSPISFIKIYTEGIKTWRHNELPQNIRASCVCVAVTHQCLRNKAAPNDLLLSLRAWGHVLLVRECKQQWHRLVAALMHTDATGSLRTTGSREWEFARDTSVRRNRERLHAWARRCRNSSRATINPDTKAHSCMANVRSSATALAQLHWFQHKHSSKI